MRRWNNWLLPVLTGLVALLAVLLPPRLSQLRDGQLLGRVHTEVLAAENGLNAQPLALSERMELLGRWQAGGEGMAAASQELEDREALAELAAENVTALVDRGILPPGLPAMEAGELYGERLLLQDPQTGAGASFLSVSRYVKERVFWLLLDEESGHILRLEIGDPLVRKADLDVEEVGGAFFELLGVEARLLGAGPREALFQLSGLTYVVTVDDWLLGIRPSDLSPSASVAVDGAAGAAAVR